MNLWKTSVSILNFHAGLIGFVGEQVRPEVNFGPLQSQLRTNVVPVKQDRILGEKQHLRDLLVGFTLLHQIGHTDFHGGEI